MEPASRRLLPVLGLGVGSGVVAYTLGQALNAITDVLGLVVGLRSGWWNPRGGSGHDRPDHRADRRPVDRALLPRPAHPSRRPRPRGRGHRAIRPGRGLTLCSRCSGTTCPRQATQALSATRQKAYCVPRRVPPSRSVDHRADRTMGVRGDRPRARRDQRRRRRGPHRERGPHRGRCAGRRDAPQVRQRRVDATHPHQRRACAPGGDATRTTGGRKRRNTKSARGAMAGRAAVSVPAHWSRSSLATAFSTTCPARRLVRSELTSREQCPTARRRRSPKRPPSSTTCGTATRRRDRRRTSASDRCRTQCSRRPLDERPLDEHGRSMKRNTIVFWLVLAVGLVLVALAAGAPPNDGKPLDPRDRSTRREGARAHARRARG